VVALPDQLFYNTGISTYFWVVTNRKRPERRGKVQLVDARELFVKRRKSLGEKRKEISPEQIAEITRIYGDFAESERVKILPNEAFGFLRITVERPLRLRWSISDETLAAVSAAKGLAKLDEASRSRLVDSLQAHLGLSEVDRGTAAKVVDPAIRHVALTAPQTKAVWDALSVRDAEAPAVLDRKGRPEPDSELRDGENVPLPPASVVFEADPIERLRSIEYRTAVDDYMTAEVLPYVEDAWVDHDKTKIGYEIPLTRHFYKYVPPRPLAEIDAELKALEAEIQELLREVTE
jgi:type I restriction enzyme M protein